MGDLPRSGDLARSGALPRSALTIRPVGQIIVAWPSAPKSSSRVSGAFLQGLSPPTATSVLVPRVRPAGRSQLTAMTCPGGASCAVTAAWPKATSSAGVWWLRTSRSADSESLSTRPGSTPRPSTERPLTGRRGYWWAPATGGRRDPATLAQTASAMRAAQSTDGSRSVPRSLAGTASRAADPPAARPSAPTGSQCPRPW
jgi:hypothetical protein